MSANSVGVGTSSDLNENPLSDSNPSKTLGAESGRDPARAVPGGDTPQVDAQPDGPVDEAGLAHSALVDGLGRTSRAGQEQVTGESGTDPGQAGAETAFPDGPNVAPSPWELAAARGHADKPV